MAIQTTVDRLIQQWDGAPRLRALAQLWLDTLRSEIDEPLAALQRQRSLETAEGVFLDRLGDLLGCPRPAVAADADDLFGFQGAGVPFDQGRLKDERGFGDPVEPIADPLYRRLLRARRNTILGDGSVQALREAAAEIDSGASVEDGLDMTVTITTAEETPMTLAVACRAVGAPAGVTLAVVAA